MAGKLQIICRSTCATLELGRLIGELARPNAVLALDGEMGTGKTTFVRGLAAGLGVAEGVTSPTYTLMHTYEGRLSLFHFDAWMQGREQAFLEGGAADWFHSGGVSVVEWARRVAPYLPTDRLEIELSHPAALRHDDQGQLEPDQERGMQLLARGPASKQLLVALTAKLIKTPLLWRFL